MNQHAKLLGLSITLAFAAAQAQATVLYKDVTTTDINTPANWSTTRGADTPDPGSIGTNDSLRFDQYFAPTAGTMYTATLSADLTVGSVRSDYWTTGAAFGNVTISGANTLTLMGAGDSNYGTSGIVLNAAAGGTLTINSNLALGANQSWTLSRALTVGGNLNLGSYTLTVGTYGSSNTTLISGAISGTGGLTKTQPGRLQIGGTQGYSGTTDIQGGYLEVTGSALSLANSVLNIGSGADATRAVDIWAGDLTVRGLTGGTSSTKIVSNGSRTLAISTQTGDSYTYSGVIANGSWNASAVLSLTKSGAGTQTLSGINTYTGGTTVNGGTLRLTTSSGGTGTIRGTLTANSGTTIEIGGSDVLGYSTGSDAVRTINLNGATLVQTMNRNETSTAVINMAGGSTISATGGASALFDLFGGTAAISSTGDMTNTISSPLRFRQDSTTFTVADGAAATDLLVSGNISENGAYETRHTALVKAGAGTMVLSAANNYTGNTNVNAGTLVVDGSIEDSGLTTVAGGATLAGIGTVGTTTVSGTLSPGHSIGTLTILGNLTLLGAADFEIDRGLTPNADLANVSGDLTYGGTLNVTNIGGALQWGDTFNLFDWGGDLTGSFTSVNLPDLSLYDPAWSWRNDLMTLGSITVVPEPASVLGLSLVLSSALLFRRRHG